MHIAVNVCVCGSSEYGSFIQFGVGCLNCIGLLQFT